MTNYNLEEFKAWLETRTDLENRRLLPQFFEMVQAKRIELEQFTSIDWGKHHYQDFGSHVTKLLGEWKAQVDQRERERERAKWGK